MEKSRGISGLSDQKPRLKRGINYLFLIGIDQYKHVTQLSNAVKDAEEIRNILLEKYQFDPDHVFELFDDEASEENIMERFSWYAEHVKENDNLLIYFSGHGKYHDKFDEGYWIPVEGKSESAHDCIPNSTIIKVLGAIKSRHTFLISDACFSGSLFEGHRAAGKTTAEKAEAIPSRYGLTSGGKELVSDGRMGEGSPFSKNLIETLKYNTQSALMVSDVIQEVKKRTGDNEDQKPIGNPLAVKGHVMGGEFVFRLAGSEVAAAGPVESETLNTGPDKLQRPRSVPSSASAPGGRSGRIGSIARKYWWLIAALSLAGAYLVYKLISEPDLEEQTIQLTSEPPGAEVWVDGAHSGVTGETPVRIESLRIGEIINLKVTKAGYEDRNLVLLISESGVEERVVKLWPNGSFPSIVDDAAGGIIPPEMVLIPEGKFMMGSSDPNHNDDEREVHEVSIKSFYLGKTEVSFGQYRACVSAGACTALTEDDKRKVLRLGDDFPAVMIDWNDAQDYVNWLSEITQKHYRLPSEAEWEYAARAGTTDNAYWGTAPPDPDRDSVNGISFGVEKPWDPPFAVFNYLPNPFGLHNMLGNVDEWVEDCVHLNYAGAPIDGSPWLEANGGDCAKRVKRSLAYDNEAHHIRVSFRKLKAFTTTTYETGGFRVARDHIQSRE